MSKHPHAASSEVISGCAPRCNLQCVMRLTKISGKPSLQPPERSAALYPNKTKLQSRWYSMSLGMDQEPYDRQTARQTNSQTEVKGRGLRTNGWNKRGTSNRPCVGMDVGETQDYLSWENLFSTCNPIPSMTNDTHNLPSSSSST